MRKLPAMLCGGLLLLQAVLTLSGQSGCGGDNLQFLGNDNGSSGNVNDNVAVSGTVAGPPSATQLAVFVFINLTDPGSFSKFQDVKNSVVNVNTREFSVPNLDSGNAWVYVADDANKDSQLESSEKFALVADSDNCLRGLKNGDRLRIDEISVDFSSQKAQAQGITKNGVICSGNPATPTPSPTPSPSPSP